MPHIPTPYCEHLGCKKPRARKSSFCEEHRLSKPVRKRSEGGLIRDAHYADRQWKEQSRLFLASNTVDFTRLDRQLIMSKMEWRKRHEGHEISG